MIVLPGVDHTNRSKLNNYNQNEAAASALSLWNGNLNFISYDSQQDVRTTDSLIVC